MAAPNNRRRKLALVTGASSGIGDTFARRLARSGYDLVLVARNVERLEALAGTLREAGTRVEVLPADLGQPLGLAVVEARLAAEPPIDLLVNNAGFGTAGPVASLDPDREEEEVRVNCIAPLRLARAVLPGMLERKRGAIINVSSIAGFQPGPFTATYSASKAFLTTWSTALHEEVRSAGIVVQALCPGFTRTEFQQRAGVNRDRIPAVAWMSADEVVSASLRALKRRRAVCIPGARNSALVALSRAMPMTIVRRTASLVGSGIDRPESRLG